jgi:phosphoribosylformylglycinamidine synthase
VLGSRRGVAVGNGICPQYGDYDPYRMAMCAVDEAIRNVVSIGADPDRIAILDNFSWGDCKKPEVLGAMVRACEGCYDAALLYGTPFVSGKDSLNNEFRGEGETIRIPHTLLISAMGQIDDVTRCVTSDAKKAGNKLVLVGLTWNETGGGFLGGGEIPQVRETAPATMRAVANAIAAGSVRSCHDLSEGGLAVAAAEMAIGGGLGVRIDVDAVECGETIDRKDVRLFSETPTRFLLEVEGEIDLPVPHAVVGEVIENKVIDFGGAGSVTLDDARASFFHWENLL